MGAPLPWFPFYINDFELDEAVRCMTFEQRGVYAALLCWQWREGSIPRDPKVVSKVLIAPVNAVRIVLARCFQDDGSHLGRVINTKLADLRVKQLQKAGKQGDASRGWKTTEERFLYAAVGRFQGSAFSNDKQPNLIKIGWSRNPKNRISAVGRETRSFLTLLGMRPATINLERKAHADLGAFKVEGEWFEDVPPVRDWLEANGVTGGGDGHTDGVPSGNPTGRVRERIRSQIQKSLLSADEKKNGNGSAHPDAA